MMNLRSNAVNHNGDRRPVIIDMSEHIRGYTPSEYAMDLVASALKKAGGEVVEMFYPGNKLRDVDGEIKRSIDYCVFAKNINPLSLHSIGIIVTSLSERLANGNMIKVVPGSDLIAGMFDNKLMRRGYSLPDLAEPSSQITEWGVEILDMFTPDNKEYNNRQGIIPSGLGRIVGGLKIAGCTDVRVLYARDGSLDPDDEKAQKRIDPYILARCPPRLYKDFVLAGIAVGVVPNGYYGDKLIRVEPGTEERADRFCGNLIKMGYDLSSIPRPTGISSEVKALADLFGDPTICAGLSTAPLGIAEHYGSGTNP